MLTIRLARGGRRNSAFFRIVLTEHSKPADSGFIKVLGWYDPHSKKISLEKEEILQWVKVGAKPSNSLSKLLKQNKVTHKNIKFVPDAKGAPKTKEKKEAAPVKAPAAAVTESPSAGEETGEKQEETKTEAAKEKQEEAKKEAEAPEKEEAPEAAEVEDKTPESNKKDEKPSEKITEEA